MAGLAAAVLAFAATVPAALAAASPKPARLLSWADPPLAPGWQKDLHLPAGPQPAVRFPPGWNKHPPLPAHAHALATGGMPAWPITLIVAAAVLLATALAVAAYRVRATRRRVTTTPA